MAYQLDVTYTSGTQATITGARRADVFNALAVSGRAEDVHQATLTRPSGRKATWYQPYDYDADTRIWRACKDWQVDRGPRAS